MYVRAAAAAMLLVVTVTCSEASAWGCEGHRAVVFIAERLLSPAAIDRIKATLAAAPIDPALSRFCDPIPDDPIADSSTWADDFRSVDPTTAGRHFINLPRSFTLTVANAHSHCPNGNCVVEAVVSQFQALTTSTDPIVKGNALRFLLHFLGDLHQPLHASTNGDRGGNCVPITYFDRVPQQNANGDFSPNLHGVWDTSTIRTLMTNRDLADARALAGDIVTRQPLPSSVVPRQPTTARVVEWVQAAHVLARTVAYARLPTTIPTEPSSAAVLASCAENNNVAQRMLARHEVIAAHYEQTSVPIIVQQLRLAGIRLAAVLKAAFP